MKAGKYLVIISWVLFALAPLAVADVSGTLSVTNCAGGGVTISNLAIDWLPTGGGSGCIATGATTNVAYSSGVLGAGNTTGIILDLSFGSPLPTTDFMTFGSAPGLHFDLTAIGPGDANTNCTGLTIGASCSPFAGSPFVLTSLGTTATLVSFSASGTAHDSGTGVSIWSGAFTTQVSNMTAAQIQTTLNGGGSFTSTESGDFTIQVSSSGGDGGGGGGTVPEPASLLLLGTGLVTVAGAVRRKLRG